VKSTPPGEPYNLRDDLSRKHNRYADDPARVIELKRLLEAAIARRDLPAARE